MRAIRHIEQDRDHADGKTGPAGDPKLFLKFALPGHLFGRFPDSGAQEVPHKFRVLHGLICLLVFYALHKACDCHCERDADKRKDRQKNSSRLLPRVDPVRGMPGGLPCASFDKSPHGKYGQHCGDQYAQQCLDDQKYSPLSHISTPYQHCRILLL